MAWKPVATTSTSIGRSMPSAVTIASPVTFAIGSVTRSTCGSASVGVVGVRQQDPLAADLEVGREPGAQVGVVDAALEVAQRQQLGGLRELRLPGERRDVGLATPVDRLPVDPLQRRQVAEREPLGPRVAPVVAGEDVRRRPLVDVEVADRARDLRHDLDRRRAGADHGDPLAGEVDVVVPAGRVEDLALERLDALAGPAASAPPARRRR